MSEDLRHTLARLQELDKTLLKIIPAQPRVLEQRDVYQDDILPFDLYRGKRENITRIGDQINKAFYFGIYDGCAVLMRRLIEMLLVLAFKWYEIDNEIKGNDGNYKDLSIIINAAKSSPVLGLSQYAKEYLNPFREKGNLSAHNYFYNARKNDIEHYQPHFRALVEELFYKAGIIK
jgi:hypothetical protein